MRDEKIIKFLGICAAVLIAAIILNAMALHAVRRQYAPGAGVASSIFNVAGQVREWIGYINQWRSLAEENASLRAEADKYVAAQAMLQSAQAENDALRKTLGLSAQLKRKLIPAGMFDVSLAPTGYQALINKGKDANFAVGQAVATPDGILIGKISAVFSHTAQVTLVTDPSFSATVKVLSGTASGILRGALSDGLRLDLITQSDPITEGDKLVTTGNDLVPGGLVVGVVRNVQANDTQLFKKVSVNPAADFGTGAVAVVQP